MNPKKRRLVPNAVSLAALAAGLTVLSGCRIDPEATPVVAASPVSASRAAVVADMRAKAQFADLAPYPSVAASAGTFPHPQSVEDVAAQQAELELLAARRRGRLVSGAELARLEARAAELRRLARAAKAGQ